MSLNLELLPDKPQTAEKGGFSLDLESLPDKPTSSNLNLDLLPDKPKSLNWIFEGLKETGKQLTEHPFLTTLVGTGKVMKVVRWPFWRAFEHPISTIVTEAQGGKVGLGTLVRAGESLIPFKKVEQPKHYEDIWNNYYKAIMGMDAPDWYKVMASYGTAMGVETPVIRGAEKAVERLATRPTTPQETEYLQGVFKPLKDALGKRGLDTSKLHPQGNVITLSDDSQLFMNKPISAVLRGDKVRVPRWAKIPETKTISTIEAPVKMALTPIGPEITPITTTLTITPPVSMPDTVITEELFETPEDIQRVEMERSIDKYMAGEPGKGNLYSIIKSEGGISPYSKETAGGLKEEYRENVPLVLRSKAGLALDEMASTLAENYPHLGITDESSLLSALEKEKALRQQPSAGGIVHIFPQKLTEKGVAIIDRENTIKITQDTDATDIYGNKVKLPKGEEYTPYKLSNQQILLQDGEQIVINKNQFQNIKGKNVELGEKFAPELAQVEEVVKGNQEGLIEKLQQEYFHAKENFYNYADEIDKKYGKDFEKYPIPVQNKWRKLQDKYTQTISNEEKQRKIIAESQTKFSQYQLPGGENYQEVLIKVGAEVPELDNIAMDMYGKKYTELKGANEQQTALMRRNVKRQYNQENPNKRALETERENIFRSPHWDEPNVLAHIRMNDRTTPDGKKVLFIEEIQSDWARKAREAKIPKEAVVQFYPPEHPLLKNWQELALKRAVKEAVEKGYDYISWVTGEQTAERYSLAKQVDKVDWDKSKNKLTAYKGGSKVIEQSDVTQENISSYIGKDAAQKIIDKSNVSEPDGTGKEFADSFSSNLPTSIKFTPADSSMVSVIHYDQIRYSIVSNLPIDVVNNLKSLNISPYDIFSDKSVVTKILSSDKGLPILKGIVSTLGKIHTTLRAKLLSGYSAGVDVNLFPTLKASDLSSNEVLSLTFPDSFHHLRETGGVGKLRPTTSGAETSFADKGGKKVTATFTDFLNWHKSIIAGNKPISQVISLSGNELSVSPIWAKNLYDRQIPNILKDLTKGEVGSVRIKGDNAPQKVIDMYADQPEHPFTKKQWLTQPALKITPEIKVRVIGQPMAGGKIHKGIEEFGMLKPAVTPPTTPKPSVLPPHAQPSEAIAPQEAIIPQVTPSLGKTIGIDAQTGLPIIDRAQRAEVPIAEEKVKEERIEEDLFAGARKYKSAAEFIKAITEDRGGVGHPDYAPWKRLVEGQNNDKPITDFGIKPDEIITIYRGIDNASQKTIEAGDYVALSYDLAKTYTAGKVISKKVPASSIWVGSDDGFTPKDFLNRNEMHIEAVYNPNALIKQSQLTDIWNKANEKTKQPKSEAGSANLEILTAPFRAIANKLDAVQYQVKHPISKAIVNDIQYVNIRAHRAAAEWLMRVDYFRGLKKEYDTLLTDLMENKHIDLPKEEFNKLFVLKQKLRKSLEEAWQKANTAGVKVKITDETGTHWRPIGKIENYVPREIHPDIKEQLDGGLKQLYEKMLELRDRGIKQNVKQAILSEKKTGNTYIVRLLKWLEEKEMKASASTIVRLIDKLIHRDYIASYGHLERPRLIADALPPEFYERRASVLFTRYFASAARRIAEIERFGQTNEKLLRRLRFVERVNPQEGKILRDLLKTYQDKTKHEIAHVLASVISTVKIGLGTSTIPNITQTLISTIPKQGVFNFLKGAYNLIVDPQTKLFIQKTGLPYTDVVRGIIGYENYGLLGRVNDLLLTANWFKGINRLNSLLTAASTEQWIKKVLLPASRSNWKLRKDWANDNLAKLKIYPKDIKEGKVSDEKLIDAMYLAASNYQLFSDITNEPLFLSKPEWRWLTILKRFGYKQGLFVIHEVIYDELKYANPLPLLCLIAGGILGGAFVIWANRKIYDTITWTKEKITGETREPPDWYSKWDDEDVSIMNRAIDLISQAGTVGALSDITRLDSKGKWSLERQAEFQLKPVVVSETERALRIVDIFKKGETKKGRRVVEVEPKERIIKALQEVMKAFPITKFFMEKKD